MITSKRIYRTVTGMLIFCITFILFLCTKGDAPTGPVSLPGTLSFEKDTLYTYVGDTAVQKVICENAGNFIFIWWGDFGYDTITSDTFTKRWNETGPKHIIVWAVDENGNKITQDATFEVIVKSGTPIITSIKDTSCFINDSITFYAHATDENGQITTYFWSTDAGKNYISGDSNFSYSWNTPGQKTMFVKAVDDDSIQSKPDTFHINVLEGKPVITLSQVQNHRVRDTVTFSATSYDTNGVVATYVWHYIIGVINKTDTVPPGPFQIVWPDTGKKIVSLQVIDDDGIASLPDTCLLTITYGAKPVVDIINNTASYMKDTLIVTATGTDSDGTISRFIWSVNNSLFQDTTAAGLRPFFWSDSGKKVVRVRAIDNDGQLSNTDSCIVTVKAGVPAGTAVSDTTVSVTCNCAVSKTLRVYDENLSAPGLTWFLDTGATTGWDYIGKDSTYSFAKPEGGTLRVIWRACDDDSNFTKLDTFNITFNRPPVCTLKSPVDTANWYIVPSSTGKGSVIFKWNCSDPDGSSDIASYNFYLGKTADNLQLLYCGLLTSDTISNLDTLTQYTWKVTVKDKFSDSALVTGTVLTQYGPPLITSEPNDTTLFKGDTVYFKIGVNGHDFHYKWLRNNTIIDTLHSVLTIAPANYSDKDSTYRCIVSNEIGADTSRFTKLIVKPRIPVIDTTTPVDTTVMQRTKAWFRVSASGDSLKYQWQKNDIDITSGGNDSVYVIDSAKLSDNGATFRCIVSNSSGGPISRRSSLLVKLVTPIIITHPADTAAGEGSRVRLKVIAFGDSLVYQWQKDSANIDGKTSDSLVFESVTLTDAGEYLCVVSNSAGIVKSNEAKLKVDTTYSLTITTSAGGTVSPTGTIKVISGCQITITASANTGYVFNGWTVESGNPTIANSTSSSTTISISEDAIIKANFTAATYTLTVSSTVGGTTTPAGATTVSHGVAQTITATPISGYVFSGWGIVSGSAIIADSSLASTTVNVTGTTTIRANFTATMFTLTINSSTGGSTTPSGNVTLNSGVSQSINATPSSGYTFKNWTFVSGTPTITNTSSATTTVSITGNATIQANFEQQQVTIALSNELQLPVKIYINGTLNTTIAAQDDDIITIPKPSSLKVEWRLDRSDIDYRGEYLKEVIIETSSVNSSYTNAIDNTVAGQVYYYARVDNLLPYQIEAYFNESTSGEESYSIASYTLDDFGYFPQGCIVNFYLSGYGILNYATNYYPSTGIRAFLIAP